jgi:hypothetical protein
MNLTYDCEDIMLMVAIPQVSRLYDFENGTITGDRIALPGVIAEKIDDDLWALVSALDEDSERKTIESAGMLEIVLGCDVAINIYREMLMRQFAKDS